MRVLTFSPSLLARQTMVIRIAIRDDLFVERRENLDGVLVLDAPDPAVTLIPAEASINIIDNDGMYKHTLNVCLTLSHIHVTG